MAQPDEMSDVQHDPLLLDANAVSEIVSPKGVAMIAWIAGIRHIRETVKDPALQQKLIPDYPIGCKRVLLSGLRQKPGPGGSAPGRWPSLGGRPGSY